MHIQSFDIPYLLLQRNITKPYARGRMHAALKSSATTSAPVATPTYALTLHGGVNSGRRTLAARLAPIPLPRWQDGTLVVVVDWRIGLTDATVWALRVISQSLHPRIVVALNKMDLGGFEYEVFKSARDAVHARFAAADLDSVVPIAALSGEGALSSSDRMDWYAGPTLLSALNAAVPRRLTVAV